MLALIWISNLLRRRAGRLAVVAVGIALAVGLIASIGAFISHSKGTMTQRSVATVAVDWQVQVAPGADPRSVLTGVSQHPGVSSATSVEFAKTTGLRATTGGTAQVTGPGVVLGVAGDYRTHFPDELRNLSGAHDGVLLAQQTAANLHAAPGDIVTIGRAGLSATKVRIDGVVDLPQADSLFQQVGAVPGSTSHAAPPDNVLLLPAAQWHRLFDAMAVAHPDLVSTQIHARISHQLPTDPSAAFSSVSRSANNLEAKLVGAGRVGDNLAAALSAAREDALYAQVLFVFLGLPGVVLAALLTATVAAAGAPRRRREQALLRARGAGSRVLAQVALVETAAVAAAGALLGLGLAAIVGSTAFHSARFGASTGSALLWAGLAVLAGTIIAAIAIAIPTVRDGRGLSVAAGRRSVVRVGLPRWARYGLDFLLLLGGLIVYWLTSRSGYKLVLAPEGQPSISVSYWAFAGPALLWTGGALLIWRLGEFLLRRGRSALAFAIAPVSGPLADTVAAGMSRQRRLLARGVTLVALAGAFAVSTAVFNATYRQQARVDALLVNGADVTVAQGSGAPLGPAFVARVQHTPGVASVEPMQHRLAYVGADLQDLFGVDPHTIVGATKLQDAYFQGGGAKQLMATLALRPDNILVSAETVKDYQLLPGDQIKLRLQDARTHQYRPIVFHYAGIVKEFPTAPRDSFLVANRDYIARATGNNAASLFLVNTDGTSPRAVAGRVRAIVGNNATVSNLSDTRKVVGSSLTAVDLAGLTKVELGFALALAAAAGGLVLWLGLSERRRTFAIASALGARRRQLGGFVWSEVAFIGLGGVLAGAVGGWGLSEVLVKVLNGVFDPPPAALAVPWVYLALAAAVTVISLAVSGGSAIFAAGTSRLEALRDV